MPTLSLPLAYVHAVALLSGALAPADDAPLHVDLASTSKQYVIGEPVVLHVTVKNVGNRQIRTWVDQLAYQIEVYLAPHGEGFRQFTRGTFWLYNIEPSVEPLAPGESKVYVFRVLYTYYRKDTPERRSGLAFDKVGVYRVKARYPLYPKREMFESNTIEIRIKEPEGVDANVWERIRRPECMHFLQSGQVPRDHENIPSDAAELLQAIPKSSYTPALEYALEKHYERRRRRMTREQALEDPELKLIRSVTGIEEPPEGPFPYDPRLDVEISYHFPELTPIADACKQISQQAGVPLSVAPGVPILGITGVPKTESLRHCMISLSAGGRLTKWIADGDGYRLVPVAEPE